MGWDLFGELNLFGVFAVCTASGFLIGYLMGYIWTQWDRRNLNNTLGLNHMKTPQPNPYTHTAPLQESYDSGLIKLHSMPVGYQPWKPTREYAKGA